MLRVNKFLGILSLILATIYGVAQTKRQLNDKRERNKAQIELTRQILSETRSQQIATLRTLNTFQKQISIREEMLLGMERDLFNLEGDINVAREDISGITNELRRIKSEFSEAVVAGYKNSRKVSKMHFIFQSGSFNDLIRRLNYLERIIDFRRLQLDLIQRKKKENSQKVDALLAKQKAMNALLKEKEGEAEKLKDDKETYEELVVELKGKEKDLLKEIKRREALDRELEEQIREQIRLARTPKTEVTENNTKMVGFQRGSLPWPVKSGYVSEHFGRHKHQDLKNITTENNGINIVCNANERIYPVYEGQVSAIIQIPGMQTTVLVKHGNYYSVYANLQNISCTKGQDVSQETTLGEVGLNTEGVTELHFEIWEGTIKLNPETWLIPR